MNFDTFTYFAFLERSYHSADDYDCSCPNLIDEYAEWDKEQES